MLCPKYIPTTDMIACGSQTGVTMPFKDTYSVTVFVKSKNNTLKPVVTSIGTTVLKPKIGASSMNMAILMNEITRNLRIHWALGFW